jgi:hypothetical protein
VIILAAALNYDAASAAATSMRDTLLPVTYFICFLGFVEGVAKSRGDGERIVMSFIVIALIAILTVNYPIAITILRDSINSTMDTNNAHVNNLFYQMVNAKLPDQPWITDIGNYILYGLIKLLQGIGKVGIMIVDVLQNVSLLALIAISPILLGMLATSWTQGAGARFLMTSLIICMWKIGVGLVDLVLYALGQYIFATAITAGGGAGLGAIGAGTAAGVSLTTLALPAVVLAMAVAAFVPIALYLAVPILMHAVMLGANPLTAALSAGAGIAATAVGITTAGAARTIGTTAAFRGSRGSRDGAGETNRASTGNQDISTASQSPGRPMTTAEAGGQTDNGSTTAGVIQHPSGAYSAAPGASYSNAATGTTVQAPGGSGMTATQSDGNFSVTTQNGRSQTFGGNLGSPEQLAAAYNFMSSTPPRSRIESAETLDA